MRLDKLCSLEFRYLDSHFPKPYGDESGPGWGIGEGTVSGERLSGTITWSNHPSLRCDGVALPDFRGLISTADGAKVLVSFTGRLLTGARGRGHRHSRRCPARPSRRHPLPCTVIPHDQAKTINPQLLTIARARTGAQLSGARRGAHR